MTNLSLIYIINSSDDLCALKQNQFFQSIPPALEIIIGVLGDNKHIDIEGLGALFTNANNIKVVYGQSKTALIRKSISVSAYDHIVFTQAIDHIILQIYSGILSSPDKSGDICIVNIPKRFKKTDVLSGGKAKLISYPDLRKFLFENSVRLSLTTDFYDIIMSKRSLQNKLKSFKIGSIKWNALMNAETYSAYGSELSRPEEIPLGPNVLSKLYSIGKHIREYYVENTPKNLYELKTKALRLCTTLNEVVRIRYYSYLKNSRKKCLLIFSNESSANQFGIGTYVKSLSSCFDLSEWDVMVVKMYTALSVETILFENQIAFLNFPNPKNFNSNWTEECERRFDLSVFYRLASVLNSKRIFCHFNIFGDIHLLKLFKEKLNAQIIFTVHYMSWRFNLQRNVSKMRRIIKAPQSRFEQIVYNEFLEEQKYLTEYCDYVIAIARHSYKLLTTLYELPAAKIFHIPHGVMRLADKKILNERNDIRARMRIAPEDKIILFVGRLESDKGIFALADAFSDISKNRPEVHLLIIGSGNYTEAFRHSYECWKQIHFLGYIPHNQLKKYYAAADIGVVPSYHEELGYVALEMLQFNLPILVSNADGLSEIVQETGKGKQFRYKKQYTGNELGEKLNSLLNENCSRATSPYLPAKYSFRQFRNSVNNFYRRICAKSEEREG